MLNINDLSARVLSSRDRSAWDRGVTAYAADLLDSLKEGLDSGYIDVADLSTPDTLEAALLNGADSWKQYSYGGSALCYDRDIAERLCAPHELRKTRNGERRPNSRETWLDTQARALYQAAERIKSAAAALEAEKRENAGNITVTAILPSVLPAMA